MSWERKKYIVRLMCGEAIGLFDLLCPDNSTVSLSLTLMNGNGEFVDLTWTDITNDAEYDTLKEFDLPELEVVKESVEDPISTRHVLLRRPPSK